MGVTYDTGALMNRRDLWALHLRSLQKGERPVVPAAVLGQAWRGGPQAQLSRLLRGCRIEDFNEPRARAVGVACARSGVRDIVDAAVVVGAMARRDVVVTSDPDDLEKIVSALEGPPLRIHRV